MKKMLTALVLASLCMLTTACDGDDPAPADPPQTTVSVIPSPGSTWKDGNIPTDLFTALAVQLFWEQQTEESREAVCFSSGALGTEWVADQMRGSAEGQDVSTVDYTLAAQMIEERCVKEGN